VTAHPGDSAQGFAGLVVESSGRVVIGGDSTVFQNGSEHGRLTYIRYLPNGQPDPSFGAGGTAAGDRVVRGDWRLACQSYRDFLAQPSELGRQFRPVACEVES
jgi:hypothetical protein